MIASKIELHSETVGAGIYDKGFDNNPTETRKSPQQCAHKFLIHCLPIPISYPLF